MVLFMERDLLKCDVVLFMERDLLKCDVWINCGLRSFGLTFRTSRSARRVPQLASLALHTAGSTAQASQFAQSWLGSIRGLGGHAKQRF